MENPTRSDLAPLARPGAEPGRDPQVGIPGDPPGGAGRDPQAGIPGDPRGEGRDERFLAFPQFNVPGLEALVGSRSRLKPPSAMHFPGDTLADRLARALAHRRALPFKEVVESFEFFWRVRRRLEALRVADLMCGHGLTGVLFAVYSRAVEEVLLLDRRRPDCHDAVMEAVAEVAPWAVAKVRFIQDSVRHGKAAIPSGTSVVGVHACGGRTDDCIDVALATGGALAVMPCCHRDAPPAPLAVTQALGPALAWEVYRTYRLEGAGYRVRWMAVPAAVTTKNRILVAERR